MDAKNKKDISNLLDPFKKLKAINPAIVSKPRAEPVIPPWVLKYSSPQLVPPFSWFGGKRRVARIVWKKFGADK